MVRLILLNGLPGSGKSTLARCYGADHPLSLVLDIDEVRGLLGDWQSEVEAGLELGRALALAMAPVALAAGRDVIVPQFLGRPEFIVALSNLAVEAGASFFEVMLDETPERAIARLVARSAGLMTPAQRDAHALLDRSGGFDTIPNLHQRLEAVCGGRPATLHVTPILNDVEATYRALLAILALPGGCVP